MHFGRLELGVVARVGERTRNYCTFKRNKMKEKVRNKSLVC